MANATKYIKIIASAQPDAIATALKRDPLPREMVERLKSLSEAIAKAPKGLSQKRTPENDFLTIIIPILEKLAMDQAENPNDFVIGEIKFEYHDVWRMDLEQLVGHHGL